MATTYLPWFGAIPTRVTVFQADEDTDAATAQTVALMAHHVARAAGSREVRHALRRALGQTRPRSRAQRADHIFWWVKRYVRFTADENLLQVTGHDGELEALIAPERLLTMSAPAGDCDDYTMLVVALLLAADVPAEVVTVAADPNDPLRWSHVYAQAVMESGQRLALDASHGHYAGWECPRVFRRRVWPVLVPVPVTEVQ